MDGETMRRGSSVEDLQKWLGHIDRELESLAKIALGAYPKDSVAQRRAHWSAIRLHFMLNTLRSKLGLELL